MSDDDSLIPKHGGFEQLKSYRIAEVIYDVTVLFCDKYVTPRSRPHDQMVQAARSGKQNLAEGSVDSAVSKKIEMNLTGIAKGSLVELGLDYGDFLRDRGLPKWPPEHPALTRFKKRRCASLRDFRVWVAAEVRLWEEEEEEENTDRHGLARTEHGLSGAVRGGPCPSVSPRDRPAVLAANGALSLLNLCTYLIDRQLASQARTFEEEGGFSERLYRRRTERRKQQKWEPRKRREQNPGNDAEQ